MIKTLLMCAMMMGTVTLGGCMSFDGLAGPAAYDYNQPVQQGMYHPRRMDDGTVRAEWRPAVGEPLTGEYPMGFRQPGGYAGAEGSRY